MTCVIFILQKIIWCTVWVTAYWKMNVVSIYLLIFHLTIRHITFLNLQQFFAVNGGEEYISTYMNSSEDIKKWVEYLRGRSGYPVEKLRKYQHTDHPSIQGPWTPWTHRHPSINVAEYPCVSYHLTAVMFEWEINDYS